MRVCVIDDGSESRHAASLRCPCKRPPLPKNGFFFREPSLSLSLSLPLGSGGGVEFKHAGAEMPQRAGSNLLTLRLCCRGLALSDSSWSQLVRSCKAGPFFFSFSSPPSPPALWESVVYAAYLRAHPCLQQLSEIISLYHVVPHVGIFPAVPERLFCFLRLASARRNAAY